MKRASITSVLIAALGLYAGGGCGNSSDDGAAKGARGVPSADGSTTANLGDALADQPKGTTAVNVVVLGSRNPIVAGNAVTFTAAVAPAASNTTFPTGNLTLTIDGATSASAPLDRGSAQFTINSLAAGQHNIVAT